ncbi:pilus assembly protein TadG-related protein [Paenarthrobacter sp. NPDC092416]|uniref:pilus assembly protein TadG-related protein n=1 Tax=Paenarthrobacter sp. NPDC092416 TaxID=3364386 RepID=UPI00382F5A6E
MKRTVMWNEEHADPGQEQGQVTVLIVGYVVLALLLAATVMAVSAVYLEHKKLLSLADGAVAAAVDSYSVGSIDDGAAMPSPTLIDGRVRSVAEEYLLDCGAFGAHDRLTVSALTGSPDSGTAVVVLSAVAHPPVISFLLPDGVALEARSTARSRLTQ